MIKIIDYGLGNIHAFANTYKKLNIPCSIASTANDLETASKIILPGVGSFDYAMDKLNNSGMRNCLDEQVTVRKKPVLGICVGMQMMASNSDEGTAQGLGWIDASVKKFDANSNSSMLLPHMGWNDITPIGNSDLFSEIESPKFYFLHSYYFCPNRPDDTLATTEYFGKFTSAVSSNNIYGVQFHPEKSHHWGTQLLKNFAEI